MNRRNAIRSGAAVLGGTLLAPRSAPARELPPELDSSYIFCCPELIEITEPGPLVLPDGTAQCSWSRRPYLDLNLEDARFYAVPYFQRFRLKKWDMYHVSAPDHYLSFIIAWIGYGAFCTVYVYDREERQGLEDMHLRPPRPEIEMMRDSTAGLTEYRSKKVDAFFEVVGEHRRLKIDFPEFAGQGFRMDLDLFLPAGHESICGVHLTNPHRMHYGHKINCMTATGKYRLGDADFSLDPADCFGALDFGRGYYPPKLFWYWATASGRDQTGKLIGFNLGHGNSPAETAENAVFYDGRLHKVGVTICEPPTGDLMQPWRVWTNDGSLDLTFAPQSVRHNHLNLGLLYAEGFPALGLYSGHLTLDSGEVIPVQDLFGLYEFVDQTW